MVKNVIKILFCSIFLFSKLSAQKKPNIILFLVDDMGWQDCSVSFTNSLSDLNKRFHTPNMEQLAKEGVRFSNAYATPVCTPSRVSLMTGMNAAHHAVTNWTSPLKSDNSDASDLQFAAAPWMMNGLSPIPNIESTTYATPLPQLLNNAGYYTIHIGKAHWASAGTPGANPINLGFQVNVSGHSAGHPQSYLGKDNYGNIPGKATIQAVPDLEEYFGTDTFLTEALTLEALKAIEIPIKNQQPFFLNMAHYAVHSPIMKDKRFFQKYMDQGLDTVEAKYASMVEGMDKSLGDLMRFLKIKGIENNTIILFMSDNGGLSLTPPRGGTAHTQNLPLRAGKGSVYEGGIREPMIVKWPGVAKPNSITDQYIIIEDFFPSILEMAGIEKAKTIQSIDGKSFKPLLINQNVVDENRVLIWHYPNKWINKDGPGINYFSAIRKGSWKMVYRMRDGKKELYNLKNDLGEQNDVSNQNPEKLNELSKLISQKLREWKSPMPTDIKSGKKVTLPDQSN